MKQQNTKRTLTPTMTAIVAGFLTSIASGDLNQSHCITQAHADDASSSNEMRPPRHGDLPPELAAKLTTDQMAQLKAATSMEARFSLLKSWNIEMPARPAGAPDGRGPGGPPNVSSALKTLFDKTRTATSDADRETGRQALRDYYQTSTNDTEREAIRHFFAHHPSSAAGSSASTSSGSSTGVSQ